MENSLSVTLVPSEAPSRLVQLAKLAEGYSYKRFTLSDSYIIDTFSILSACAGATREIRLGPSVSNPYVRHPGATAIAAATLDWVSGGRAIQGVGAGRPQSMVFRHSGSESKNDQPSVAVREAITIMRMLWSGEQTSFHGKQFTFENAHAFLPSGARKIPIFLTSLGPVIERTAGEMADIAMVGSTLISRDNYLPHLANIKEGAARAKRKPGDLRTMVYLCICCSNDGNLARESAKVFAAKHFYDFIERTGADPGVFGATMADVEDMKKAVLKLPFNYAYCYPVPDELKRKVSYRIVDSFTVSGTPEECVKGVQRALSCGFDTAHLYLVPVMHHEERYDGYVETLESFSECWLEKN